MAYPAYQSKAHANQTVIWQHAFQWMTPSNEAKTTHLQILDYSEKSYALVADLFFINSYSEHLGAKSVGMVNYKYKPDPTKGVVYISKGQYASPKVQNLIKGIVDGSVRPHANSYEAKTQPLVGANAQSLGAGHLGGGPSQYASQPLGSASVSSGASMLEQLRVGPSIVVSSAPQQMAAPSFADLTPLIPGIPRAPPALDVVLTTLEKSFSKHTTQGAFTFGAENLLVVSYDLSMEYFPTYDYVVENRNGLCLMRKKATFDIVSLINKIRDALKVEGLQEGHLNIGSYSLTWHKDPLMINGASASILGLLSFSDTVYKITISSRYGDTSPSSEIKRLMFDLYRAFVSFPPPYSTTYGDKSGPKYADLYLFGTQIGFHSVPAPVAPIVAANGQVTL
jgi:hypothetical protein